MLTCNVSTGFLLAKRDFALISKRTNSLEQNLLFLTWKIYRLKQKYYQVVYLFIVIQRGGKASCNNARSMCPQTRRQSGACASLECTVIWGDSSLSCNVRVRVSELVMWRAECDAVHSDAPASPWDLISPDPHLWPRACQQSWLQGVKLDRWGVMDEERCLAVHPPSSEADDGLGCA